MGAGFGSHCNGSEDFRTKQPNPYDDAMLVEIQNGDTVFVLGERRQNISGVVRRIGETPAVDFHRLHLFRCLCPDGFLPFRIQRVIEEAVAETFAAREVGDLHQASIHDREV